MNRAVTIFFYATGAAIAALGILAIFSGQLVIGLVLAGLGGADVWTGWRRDKQKKDAKPTAPTHAPAPHLEKEPVAVPDPRALAAIPEPLNVCADCGFLAIRSGRGQGSYARGGALLSACYCPRCGYQGIPLRFDHREDYRAFVQELHTQRVDHAIPTQE